MSGQALAVAFRGGELFLALTKPVQWSRRALEQYQERRRRARARAAGLPMRAQLLRDLGMVEADARRLGLVS